MFDPEYFHYKPYCEQCDMTFLFLGESWPGGRSSEMVYCPKCQQELGNMEEDSKLLAQVKGNFSHLDTDEFAESLNTKERQKLEAEIGTPEEREAERKAFFEALEEKEGVLPDYDPMPSQVTDEPWIYAKRLQGEYPKPNSNSGKWLIFAHIDKIDDLWVKVKLATEEGKLGDASKVATAMPSARAYNEDEKVICVYTYDWTDEEDAFRVREILRSLGIIWRCSYKSNADTRQGKYSATGHRVSKYRM